MRESNVNEGGEERSGIAAGDVGEYIEVVTISRKIPARTPVTDADRANLGCRLCAWLCDRFCPDDTLGSDAFWKASRDWERDCSNEYELWTHDSGPGRALAEQALELQETDRTAAFQAFLAAAEAGSIWAMEVVGWHYDTGSVVAADFAQAKEYYYRALCAGSWAATLRYAKLLEGHGYHEYWPGVLEDGVRANYFPAYFWLAWFRYKHSRTRKTCREVRPLLEAAARNGHPGARFTLALWMMRGKFGLREIPAGFRLLRESAARYRTENESAVVIEPAERLAA